MRTTERRDSGQHDLLRSRLDQIVDLAHPLAKLARGIDWGFLEQRLGAVYTDRPGRPPLPTRLMAGLAILKHMHNLSDEDLCARWIENPYYQLLCGEEFFRHALPFDRSSITRWRQRMGEADPRFCQAELGGMVGGGEEKLIALLQESLHLATRAGAAKPSDFARVIVYTTVQPKAVAFPTDAKLLHRARERLARLARKHGVPLRQSYADARLRDIFAVPLSLARRVREQRQRQRGPKVYSLHAPEVECIGKGKAHRPYEFGVKVSVATPLRRCKGGQFVLSANHSTGCGPIARRSICPRRGSGCSPHVPDGFCRG